MDKKSIFKILVIFMLGMAIGAFVMGGVVKHRIDIIHRHQAGIGIPESLVNMTGAEGTEKEQLISLGEEYGARLKVLNKEHLKKKADLFDELEQEGILFLTGSTKEEFQHHIHRMKKGPRRGREED